MCVEDIAQPERRRSLRILALGEKKEREKQALALAREDDSSANNVSDSGRNKGKAKANMYLYDDDNDDDLFMDEFEEDEQNAPTKRRGRKSKTLDQLISSTQPMQEGQYQEKNKSSTERIATSGDEVPEKHALDSVLDCLQRKDSNDRFAEPVNPNELKAYCRIVKQPMDSCMEQPKAENICAHAQKLFHGLNAGPDQFDQQFFLPSKQPAGRTPQGRRGRPRKSARPALPPRPQGRSYVTNPTLPEIERRKMCWRPSGNSPLLDVPQQTFRFNSFNYQDSLLRFVKDLGPTAQGVAAKKLEPLLNYQLLYGKGTPRPNTPAYVSDQARITPPQSAPQAPPTQPDAAPKTADLLSHRALSLPNRPLKIPGAAASSARENPNITNAIDSINISGCAYKGKNICAEQGWDALAASVLGGIFTNYGNGASSSGVLRGESSNNSSGLMGIRGPSNNQMGTPMDGFMSSIAGNVNANAGRNRTHVGISSLSRSYMSNENVTRRPGPVRARVWPSRVISGPQPKPLEFMPVNNTLKGPFLALTRPEVSMPGHKLSGVSLLSQPRPAHSRYGMNFPGLSLVSQLKPAESMASNNMSGNFILPSQAAKWSDEDNSLNGLDTPYKPGDFQALVGSCLDYSPFPAKPIHEQVLNQATVYNPPAPVAATYGYPDSQMQLGQLNRLGPFQQQQPKSSSSALGMPLDNAMNHYGGIASQAQPELTTAQLLWDDDGKPNLALQL